LFREERSISKQQRGKYKRNRCDYLNREILNGDHIYPAKKKRGLGLKFERLLKSMTNYERRCFHEDDGVRESIPSTLVYRLPMRMLIGQTKDQQTQQNDEMRAIEGHTRKMQDSDNSLAVTVLKGSEDANEGELYPERDTIIEMQNMLFSKTSNRDYCMSCFSWSMHSGLLDNHCFWLIDKVQLMEEKVKTSAMMETPHHSWIVERYSEVSR